MNANSRLHACYRTARELLLAEQTSGGFWIGELSSSALSTATAVGALAMTGQHPHLLEPALDWLRRHQNPDGGWGDTDRSFSNIATTLLVHAAFHLARRPDEPGLARAQAWLREKYGQTPAEIAQAVRLRYGQDKTFAVPILTTCALASQIAWSEVPRLPFELAWLPQSLYRFARMPVVSYALPALIAIGQCVHHHRPPWDPLRRIVRYLATGGTRRVLTRIQPESGGFLEAAPLTSFVTMSLASIGLAEHPVAKSGVRFLAETVRSDGSWPIDTNLSVWLTSLAVNAFAAGDDLKFLPAKGLLRDWLLERQYRVRHPYTGAAAGGWAWTHLSGGVPDCDDTPGALLALRHLMLAAGGQGERIGDIMQARAAGKRWIADLQNSDGGWPTFCRGWGRLPFDRSGSDLTAHALRALYSPSDAFAGNPFGRSRQRGLAYLRQQQKPDGSWLPLWFGNQHAPDDINPTYGTSRVLAAYRDTDASESAECQAGVKYLRSTQNDDGGWGGAAGCPSSVEETALAVEVLLDLAPGPATDRGVEWLMDAVESGRLRQPSPIGFYFAKLWYYEKLYPLIWTVAALGRARRPKSKS